MSTMIVALRNIAGTEAALGWANGHTLVVDRAEGARRRAGARLQRRRAARLDHRRLFCQRPALYRPRHGVSIGAIALTVAVDIDGDPLLCRSARLQVSVELAGGADPTELVERTEAISMAANSLRIGFPVEVVRAA